jgi:multidrug efflux pump subunit AcrA (membrane-fusion protein)
MNPKKTILYLAVVIAIFVAAATVHCQQLPAKLKTAPVISEKLRGDFFKAQSEAQTAQTALEHAQQAAQVKIQAFQNELKKAQDVCGAEYQLSPAQNGEIVCVEKAKAPEPAKK